MKPNLAWVILVLLLAAAVRLNGAATHSTWSDEGWNLWVVEGSGVGRILERLASNHHPPAYFLSLAAWEQIAGDSRLALRLLAVLGGVLTVAVVYRVGADTFGHGAGVAAALIFAVVEQAVYYGQAIRHYGWLALGVGLLLLCFGRYLRRPGRGILAAYTASLVFALHIMYLGALVVAVQAFVGLFVWRGTRRDKLRLFAAYAASGVLLLPWLIYAVPGQLHKIQRGVIAGYHNSFATTPENILSMSNILLGGQFALGAGLFALAAWQILRNRSTRQFAVLLCGGGLFAAMLAANLAVGILSERTLFFLLPAVALVLGYGFQLLPPRAGIALLTALAAWALLTPQGVVPTINSGPTAREVAAGYSAGDFVLLETGFDDVAFEYEMKHTLPTEDREVFRSYYEYDYPDDASMMQTLTAELADEQRVWLVYWNVPPRMAEYLGSLGFRQVRYAELPTGENDPLYTQYPLIAVSLFARPDLTQAPLAYGDTFELRDWVIAESVPADAPRLLHVDLWWSALVSADRDYSTGVFLLDANGVTQVESIGPERPTTTWREGRSVYDRHSLELPSTLSPGAYTVIANMYWWETVEPLPVGGQPFAVLGTVTIR